MKRNFMSDEECSKLLAKCASKPPAKVKHKPPVPASSLEALMREAAKSTKH